MWVGEGVGLPWEICIERVGGMTRGDGGGQEPQCEFINRVTRQGGRTLAKRKLHKRRRHAKSTQTPQLYLI